MYLTYPEKAAATSFGGLVRNLQVASVVAMAALSWTLGAAGMLAVTAIYALMTGYVMRKAKLTEALWLNEEQMRQQTVGSKAKERTMFREHMHFLFIVSRVPIVLACFRLLFPAAWAWEISKLDWVHGAMALGIALCICSLMENRVHDDVMHDSIIPPFARRSHGIIHHGVARKKRYAIPPDARLSIAGNFPYYAAEAFVPVFMALALIAYRLIPALRTLPLLLVGSMTILAYLMAYEFFHAMVYHAQEETKEKYLRLPLIGGYVRWLDFSHKVHHLEDDVALNLVLPLGDLLMGTLVIPRPGAMAKSAAEVTKDDFKRIGPFFWHTAWKRKVAVPLTKYWDKKWPQGQKYLERRELIRTVNGEKDA